MTCHPEPWSAHHHLHNLDEQDGIHYKSVSEAMFTTNSQCSFPLHILINVLEQWVRSLHKQISLSLHSIITLWNCVLRCYFEVLHAENYFSLVIPWRFFCDSPCVTKVQWQCSDSAVFLAWCRVRPARLNFEVGTPPPPGNYVKETTTMFPKYIIREFCNP